MKTSSRKDNKISGGAYSRLNKTMRPQSYQSGQTIITAVIFFLTISIVVLVAMSVPVASQVRTAADFLQSKQGYISADTLNEEALYRLNKGRTLPATLVLAFSGTATATAQVTDVSGAKQIIATGVAGGFTRTAKSVFSQGQGISINYGVQVGNGGVTMAGSPTITGNVYSNGNINGTGWSTITGSAIAASAISQTADQQNSATGTPAVNQAFGTSNSNQDIAQSFIVSTSTPVAQASFYIKKSGTPANATISIISSTGSGSSIAPSTATPLASGTLSASQVTTSYGWVEIPFTTNPALTPGTTYWVVINMPSNSTTNTYTMGATNTNVYTAGQLKVGRVGSTWTAPNASYDEFFQIYTGGVSTISVQGAGVGGDANAFNVSNTTVSGNLYCQIGTSDNKACNTSQPVPSSLSFPFSSNNISDWKDEASAGGTYNGSINLGGVTSTSTGPLKINGDLTVGASSQLTVNGPLYVTGNFTIDGAAKMKLSSSYGASSGIIVVDGTVNISASGAISGSGTSGSYIIVESNSSCGGLTTCGSSAVTVSGAAGAVVLLAPNGKITFSGSASAKSAVGYALDISGSSNLTYDSGLSDISFTSGPSGAWNISSWQEIVQ